MRFEKARALANQLIDYLVADCYQIRIAGSIRRCKAEVKDIEIVCEPKLDIMNKFDCKIANLERAGRIEMEKNGRKYKKFFLIRKDKSRIISVDLFLVTPPAQWGVIYAIRTGPASFSKWLVSYRKPQGIQFKDGRILKNGVPQTTPTEQDVFNVLEIDFIPVAKRSEY